MDDFQTDEETGFVVEEVSKVIKELLCYIAAHPLLRTLAVARDRPYPLPQKSVEATIGKNTYQHSRVNHWSAGVVEQCLSQLSKMGKPFKYIVTCIIMQKNGAGLQTASACFWDNSTDGSCAVRWENKSMYCIVSVFGLSI